MVKVYSCARCSSLKYPWLCHFESQACARYFDKLMALLPSVNLIWFSCRSLVILVCKHRLDTELAALQETAEMATLDKEMCEEKCADLELRVEDLNMSLEGWFGHN